MNQIKLSLRAADDSRTIKEEGGVPTFATVFFPAQLRQEGKRGDDPHHRQSLSPNWLSRSSAT
jgi:hypothetical protein